ncbi:MAG: helix-turn-helix transcriptional regulator [Rhizobiales bacterium]|nr:helix-turn-helix transcriptional regulator [Hyphomicrobiales bacterium]
MARRDPNYIDVHVGNRIRMRRQIVSMSQERLGELLGITFQQVQKYEKGSNRISASRLHNTAKILGVPVQFFFEDAPGEENKGGFAEGKAEDSVMAALMNVEGVQLAKAFRDANSSEKRRIIAALARCIADMRD